MRNRKTVDSGVDNTTIDLAALIEELDFAESTLNHAVIKQGRLMGQAAKYYRMTMRIRMAAEVALEERKAFLGLKFRREDRLMKKDVKPRAKEMTEGELRELVTLQRSVRDLQMAYDEAKANEHYAKLLFQAFEWRGYSCQILGRTLDEEARGDLRIFLQKRAKEKLQEAVHKKYPGGDE